MNERSSPPPALIHHLSDVKARPDCLKFTQREAEKPLKFCMNSLIIDDEELGDSQDKINLTQAYMQLAELNLVRPTEGVAN